MNADLFARLDQVLMDAETITQEEREDILEAFPHDEPQAGHTPGPWHVRPDEGDLAIEVEGKRIARVGADSDGSYVADANLIAAAPELLEALKDLVEIAENFKVDGPYMDKAKYTIAKADGNKKLPVTSRKIHLTFVPLHH